MTVFTSYEQIFTYYGTPLLTELENNISVVTDPEGVGFFLKLSAEQPSARQVFRLGHLVNERRLLCHYRTKPYWMIPAVVACSANVPVETQFLLAELSSGQYIVIVPLLDGAFRMSLQGSGEHGLEVVAESGDPAITTCEVEGVFVAAGEAPFSLIEQAARSVSARLQTGRLRREKALPAFIDQFGWCTWDAFYDEVSHEKIRDGLESFASGGIHPPLFILDSGWQSLDRSPSNSLRLVSFLANEKFPGGLEATVQMAKNDFGVQTFLVWHAVAGSTGGVNGERLPAYGVREIAWQYSPGVLQANPGINEVLGGEAGVIHPDLIYKFYNDYHSELRMAGVDGVKIDFQTTLEALGATLGGRMELMHRYHEALEGSAHTHFKGNLINCMSCSNDMLYSALNSNLTRTSDDFFPANPDSHGLHLYANVHVGLWFGEFIHPDWDMFQSAHEFGAFHAAGRAISGGPVYVSDPPDAHNFSLLRKLVLPTGHILRAQLPGRPTLDCLFNDPAHDNAPLKIFNHNPVTGVVGAFNCHTGDKGPTLEAVSICPADVIGLKGERFAVYAHNLEEARVLAREESWTIFLAPMSFELFTISPIERGVAPLGLVEMFNSGGAVIKAGFNQHCEYEMLMHNGGKIAVWCADVPRQVWLNEKPAAHEFLAGRNLLYIYPDQAASTVHVRITLAFREKMPNP